MKVMILVMLLFIYSLALYQTNINTQLKCAPQCKNCTASDICVACIDTYYIDASQCLPCDNGTSHCANCTIQKCIDCQSKYFYLNSGVCISCSLNSQCFTCQGFNQCYTCTTNQSYRNSSGPDVPGPCISCQNLSVLCKQCVGPLTCTKCIKSEYYLKNGMCQMCATQENHCKECTSQNICTICVDQYYFVESHLCLECYHFNTGCLTCYQKDGLNYCMSCKSNSFYRLPKSQRCDSCANPIPGCSTCTYNETSVIVTCTSCFQPDFIPVIGSNSCFKCSDLKSCVTCATPQQCISCINNWFSEDGKCVQCQFWISNCSKCNYNKTCQMCKETFYRNPKDLCTSCLTIDTNCLTCSNGQKCDRCYDGYFSSDEHTRCQRCGDSCVTCSDHKNCLICSDSKDIVDGYCKDSNHNYIWIICVSVVGPVIAGSFIVWVCCLKKKIKQKQQQIQQKNQQIIRLNNSTYSSRNSQSLLNPVNN